MVFSFGKRAGKVGRFFENVEQGSRTVDAVAFGLCRLLHNSDTLQPLDCALCGREGNAQIAGYAGGGDECPEPHAAKWADEPLSREQYGLRRLLAAISFLLHGSPSALTIVASGRLK